jgi:hypothetical protein
MIVLAFFSLRFTNVIGEERAAPIPGSLRDSRNDARSNCT